MIANDLKWMLRSRSARALARGVVALALGVLMIHFDLDECLVPGRSRDVTALLIGAIVGRTLAAVGAAHAPLEVIDHE